MHELHDFLEVIAIVLCVAAVTTVLFQRLKQPVVLGYLIAGLIVGPHTSIPLVANVEAVQVLSEMGVILLMFALGLEFSLRKLASVGTTAGVTGLIQCALMLGLGYAVGQGFGWTRMESVFLGAIIAISSTTIIAKVFDEQGIRGKLRDLVVGVLVVEDLIAVLLMATLTAVATGSGLSANALVITVGKLAAFLIALVAVGLFVIPRAVRYVSRLNRPETTVVASIGICFGVAVLAAAFGYSVALGAFLAGSLVAESGEERKIEHLVQPLRDVFAAIFFVSVGMMIDPKLVVLYWVPVVVITAVVIVGKLVGVSVGAFLTGAGTRTSVQAGMSLAQIGEFSFIIAGLGLSLKATGEFLYPVAVTVSAVTTLTTPWLIRAAGPAASLLDRKLPRTLQTFAALYGSWIEKLRAPRPRGAPRSAIPRILKLIVLDAALMTLVAIGASLSRNQLTPRLQQWLGLEQRASDLVLFGLAALLAAPFAFGLVRLTRRLGLLLAESALPAVPRGKLDLAAAPRRVLVVTLQVALMLVVGLPVVAITQPFLPKYFSGGLLLAGLALLSVAFWRSATQLQGHVKAGAEAIVSALAAQSQSSDGKEHPPSPTDLAVMHRTLPGLGDPVPVTVPEGSPSVGQTLAGLNLRGATGATVLVIKRGEQEVVLPTAQETLRAGDVLALAGTEEAVRAAQALIEGAPVPPGEPRAA